MLPLITRYIAYRYRTHTKVKVVTWNDVRTLALVIDGNEPVSKHAIDAWIETSGKLVEVYFLEPRKKTPSFTDWNCLTKKDCNVLKLPAALALKKLRQARYDMVIDTSSGRNLLAGAVSAALDSGYKCATHETIGGSPLTITRVKTNLKEYLDDVVLYLKMIRPSVAGENF
jgi:hypothetical protein